MLDAEQVPSTHTEETIFALLEAEEMDEAAWAIYEKYGDSIYGQALRILHNTQDAEEVRNDVLIQILRKWESFKHESKFSTWIYVITGHKSLERLRAGKTTSRPMTSKGGASSFDDVGFDIDPIAAPKSDPANVLMLAEYQGRVAEVLNGLEDQYRIPWELKRQHQYSLQQIADELNISEPAVKSRVHRAGLQIKKALQEIH